MANVNAEAPKPKVNCPICRFRFIKHPELGEETCGEKRCAQAMREATQWAKAACDRIFAHYPNPRDPYGLIEKSKLA